ncbi:MAG: hypothetical protein ACLQU1_24335 [Bryobacteraceae bacterium]
MPSRPPKDRVIQISINAQNQFQYTNLSDGSDASVLVLIQGDHLTWVLAPVISPRTFQIDFDVVNPFQLGSPVSLRGRDSIKAPALNFPFNTYAGNRILKYSVSLGNGWTDDPDIVPSPGDPVLTGQLVQPNALITWVDPATQQQISLNPPNMTADATGGGGIAKVSWAWQGDQPNPEPFTLQFEKGIAPGIPSGWPTVLLDSTPLGGIPAIQLFLPKGLLTATTFTLTTTTGDGNQAPPIQGTLLIS